MLLQPKTLQDAALEIMCKTIIVMLKINAYLYLREMLNRLPSKMVSQMMFRILSDTSLSEMIRLKSLNIFLNKYTKNFNFGQELKSNSAQKYIIKMISILSPNIETIDFHHFSIKTMYKKDFINLLIKCKNLKKLHVKCFPGNCAIWELLIVEDFDKLDYNVQVGLQKIEALPLTFGTTGENCAKFLKFLPNLKTLGTRQFFHRPLSYYIHECEPQIRILNLTDIYDFATTLRNLENFVKYCPKVKLINLFKPDKKVVENLFKLPSLIQIELYYYDPNELLNYLKKCGKKIRRMELNNPIDYQIKCKTILKLCPNLESINYTFPCKLKQSTEDSS